jgi:hypothetical protein
MNILTTFRTYVGITTPFEKWGIINTLRKLRLELWNVSIVYVGKKLKTKYNMRKLLYYLFLGWLVAGLIKVLFGDRR